MAEESSFIVQRVAFFGRSFEEYKQMFSLDIESMQGLRILDCPSGPSSFVAEASAAGLDVVGCDPLYDRSPAALREEAQQSIDRCMRLAADVPDIFARNPADAPQFQREKEKAVQCFVDDFVTSGASRYVPGALPKLPFESGAFDMALSANFLFLYAGVEYGGMLKDSSFDLAFHLSAVNELVRVSARQVRIYPIKGPHRPDHPFLPALTEMLGAGGHKVALLPVGYKDLRGADMALAIDVRR